MYIDVFGAIIGRRNRLGGRCGVLRTTFYTTW